ncbi:hypothetical protein Fcan01_24409 [Folsomia candida]|uniref:Uncharacterized protein n=1 Tax=Folsomia candida TaxID=158441 RepID=A0A226D6F2_FOLCA|nr:hypothetical protein Fcan01_24409 [Folsomia candida]
MSETRTTSTSKALQNTLILGKIITILATSGVKEVRKVSSLWESVANPILGRRTVFSFINQYGPRDSNPSVKVQLLRRIYFNYVSLTLAQQCKFQPVMEGLQGMGSFTNLVKFQVEVHDLGYDYDTCELSPVQISHDLPNLKEFKIVSYRIKGQDGIGPFYREMTTLMLKMARNLERLIILDNFCPDLSNCKKLKYLEWLCNPYKWTDSYLSEMILCREFDITKFVGMLAMISNTLERLTFGLRDSYYSTPLPRIDPHTIPTLKNWKPYPCQLLIEIPPKLSLYGYAVKDYGNRRFRDRTTRRISRKIGFSKFALKHLTIQVSGVLDESTDLDGWKGFFRNLYQSPINISRLTIYMGIWSSFSNLMGAMDVMDDLNPVEVQKYNRCKSFSRIVTEGRVTERNFPNAACISSVSIINGAPQTHNYQYDSQRTKFENVFRTWQPNLSFVGYEFKLPAATRMKKFIKENNLGVSFVDKIDH